VIECHLRHPQKQINYTNSSRKSFALLFFLHSASYDPVGDLFPEGDSWVDHCGLEPLYVLCPKCPANYYWLMRGDSWNEEGGEWMTDWRGYSFWKGSRGIEMANALVEVLRDVLRYFPIDPERIFLSGCSMGASACLELAAHHPMLFAAIAPVGAHLGNEPMDWLVERLERTPMWMFHGLGDYCCPYEDMLYLATQLSRSAWLTTFDVGHGDLSIHNSSSHVAYVTYGRALLAWMLRQSPRR